VQAHAALLSLAIDALERGRLSDALTTLLDVWEAVRDPAVARAIERLTGALSEGRPPLEASPRAWQAAWLEREAEGHPADTAVLAVTLIEGAPGTARFKERVQRLLDRKPHPGLLARWMSNIRHIPMFPPLAVPYAKLMAHHGDPRALDAIERALALPPSGPGGSYTKTERDKRLTRLRSALRKLPTGPVPGSDALENAVDEGLSTDPSAWQALEAGATDDVLADLWAAVVASPADDGPRLVFADRVGADDPDHAVFIQRQIAYESRPRTDAERKQDARWLKKSMSDWLGPLGPYVNRKGARFRRGFLDAGLVISASENEAAELGAMPEWRTATALWCKHTAFFRSPAGEALESIGCRAVRAIAPLGGRWTTNGGGKALEVPQLRRLLRTGPFTWPVLQLQIPESQTDLALELLAALEGSVLKTLVLPSMGGSDRLANALPTQLEELVVGPWSLEASDVLDRLPYLRRFTELGVCDVTVDADARRFVIRTFEPTAAENRLAGNVPVNRIRQIRQALRSARPGWMVREVALERVG
jgi:uncharacterized protein (TIGR02996 family)